MAVRTLCNLRLRRGIRPMNGYCQIEDCGKPVENRDLGLCATHAHERRRADKATVKEKKPINKVSEKRRNLNPIYAQRRDKYLFNNPHCEYHGKDCKGGILHHKAGREGYVDEYARQHDIPALIDERYFMNLCQVIHDWATENSKQAIEEGISVSRTSKKD
jgi:hypothetical protein